MTFLNSAHQNQTKSVAKYQPFLFVVAQCYHGKKRLAYPMEATQMKYMINYIKVTTFHLSAVLMISYHTKDGQVVFQVMLLCMK